jgi:hypothetical protein
MGSLAELLSRSTERQSFVASDSKSGAGLEWVTVGGRRCVLKHVHVDDEWSMRFFGATSCVPLEVWRSGLMDVAPDHIVHGMIGAAGGLGRDGLGAALLIEDLSEVLVPSGDIRLSSETHRALIDGMAALAARMWGWTDTVGLVPLANRWRAFGDANLAIEERAGWPNAIPRIAKQGWERFRSRAPSDVLELVEGLRSNTEPLVAAVAQTPCTFVHGDWKLGNLGVDAAGRAVLLDWTLCGSGPVCLELGWYLALNAARLPCPKEDVIDDLRSALHRYDIDTEGWWDRQLGLCLLGTLVLFGWEKALGNDDEFGWWCDRARHGATFL